MSESDEVRAYYARRNRLMLFEAKLHLALCKVTENEYWRSSGECFIHPAIVHPEWEKIKDRIYPVVMIWQLAYMVYPFVDEWESFNPFLRQSYFMERLRVIYDVIDAVECGYFKNYQLPPEIESMNQLEVSSIENKAKIKIHVDDLASAIKQGGLNWWCSKWVSLWLAHTKRTTKPKLAFSPAPEPVLIKGLFDESPFFQESKERPFEMQEVEAPEWAGIKRTYVDSFILWQEKYRYKNIHPVFENQLEWLERNLNTERVIEIQPMYMAGDPKPPTYKLGEKPQPSTTPTTTEPHTNTPPLTDATPDFEALHPGNTKPKRDTRERLQVLYKCHDKNLTIEEILSECKRECPDLFDKYTLDTFSKGTGNLWQLAQGYELIPRRK